MRIRIGHLREAVSFFEGRADEEIIGVSVGIAGILIVDKFGTTTVYKLNKSDDKPVYTEKIDGVDMVERAERISEMNKALEDRTTADFQSFKKMSHLFDLVGMIELRRVIATAMFAPPIDPKVRKYIKEMRDTISDRNRAHNTYARIALDLDQED